MSLLPWSKEHSAYSPQRAHQASNGTQRMHCLRTATPSCMTRRTPQRQTIRLDVPTKPIKCMTFVGGDYLWCGCGNGIIVVDIVNMKVVEQFLVKNAALVSELVSDGGGWGCTSHVCCSGMSRPTPSSVSSTAPTWTQRVWWSPRTPGSSKTSLTRSALKWRQCCLIVCGKQKAARDYM